MIKEIFSQIPKKLASFSNDELYFIITELLGLNKCEKKLIAQRSLYIKTSSDFIGEQLTFLLIDKSLRFTKNFQETICFVSVGKLDSLFTNIHLHTVSFAEKENSNEVDIATAKVFLTGLADPIVYQPTYLIDGLLKIIQQSNFIDRTENKLFKIDQHENHYAHYFDLGIINNVDYSGMYYCIAEVDKQDKESSAMTHLDEAVKIIINDSFKD
jgi:hypothetical protein